MSVLAVESRLSVAEIGRLYREAMRDKSYQLTPIGAEAGSYLAAKRKRLTDSSFRDYESGLDKLARYFPDLTLTDLEPPVGTERVEECLDHFWGAREPRTYNKNLSIFGDFFKHLVKRGKMTGDPTLNIDRARARGVYRTAFTPDQCRAIIAAQDCLRDRIALRLLLDYGLRKGSVQAVQFKHFEYARRRLTIFAKGGKVRHMPIPHPAFWTDLERLIVDSGAEAHHFLLQRHRGNGASSRAFPDKPMGAHGMHDWWYARLTAAGLVASGTTRGEKMHKARHSAGQRLLDHTGNLKAVQQLLGHQSIQTTGDVYVGWDEVQLAESLASMLDHEEHPENE